MFTLIFIFCPKVSISSNVLRTYEVRLRRIWAERSVAVYPLLDDPLGQNCIVILSARSPPYLFSSNIYPVSKEFKKVLRGTDILDFFYETPVFSIAYVQR